MQSTSYKSANLLISSFNALLQSAGFSLKTQPRLVTSYILSRLDYCNCLLMGTPNSVIQRLQKIQNFVARLVLLALRHHHSTPILEKLHWLPISERINYKVACMYFSAINGSGPAYLSQLLHIAIYWKYTKSEFCSKHNFKRSIHFTSFFVSDVRSPLLGEHV